MRQKKYSCKFAQTKTYIKPYMCTQTNEPCVYQRWCAQDRRYKLTNAVQNCIITNKTKQETQDIIVE